MEGREFIDIKEASALLGYTVGTIHKKCHLKELPYYKPTKKVFFDRKELLQWIADHRVATSEEIMRKATNY